MGLYRCQLWSLAYARGQWDYVQHPICAHPPLPARVLSKYNFDSVNDLHSPCIPHRDWGHPHLRWGDRPQAFCEKRWPHRHVGHWFDIIRGHGDEVSGDESVLYIVGAEM